MPQPERPGRRRSLANRRPASRRDRAGPAQQTVTTACHHCLEPACLSGCPVKAYEKNPVTGIVKHLDDQCIGCQYCILMCPYDAPKYKQGPRHRAQVRHVQRSPGARRGAGLRAVVPERGHPHRRRRSHRGDPGDRGQRIFARGAQPQRHAADDGLQDRTRAAAQHVAGRLLQRQSRTCPSAIGRHVGTDAAFRGRVPDEPPRSQNHGTARRLGISRSRTRSSRWCWEWRRSSPARCTSGGRATRSGHSWDCEPRGSAARSSRSPCSRDWRPRSRGRSSSRARPRR